MNLIIFLIKKSKYYFKFYKCFNCIEKFYQCQLVISFSAECYMFAVIKIIFY